MTPESREGDDGDVPSSRRRSRTCGDAEPARLAGASAEPRTDDARRHQRLRDRRRRRRVDRGRPGPRHRGPRRRVRARRRRAGRALRGDPRHPRSPGPLPGAAPLAGATGAPIVAHRRAAFAHDRTLADGERVTAGSALGARDRSAGPCPRSPRVLLEDERALFTGDVVIGIGTVVIAPPDGDMRDLPTHAAPAARRFADARAIYGGHGPEITAPQARRTPTSRTARRARPRSWPRLGPAPQTIADAGRERSTATSTGVSGRPRQRQVLAYLIALEREGRVNSTPRGDALTREQRALLDPDLGAIVNERHAAVVRAELGFGADPQRLVDYALTSIDAGGWAQPKRNGFASANPDDDFPNCSPSRTRSPPRERRRARRPRRSRVRACSGKEVEHRAEVGRPTHRRAEDVEVLPEDGEHAGSSHRRSFRRR